MQRIPTLLSSCALLALGAAPFAAQNVIVVAADGTADYIHIDDAVAAAADGDVVLVRGGNYNAGASILVEGKSLVLAAEPGATVSIGNGPLTVRNLAPGQVVVLQGLDFTPAPLGDALQIRNCQGVVQVEDAEITGALAPHPAANVLDAILVEDCTDVVLSRVTVSGSNALYPFVPAGAGIRAVGSMLHLYDVDATGGRGGSDGFDSGPGGPGVAAEDSFLFAGGSSFQGGQGGPAGNPLFGCTGQISGSGGPGLVLAGTTTDARLLDTDLLGGIPGDVYGTCTEGSPGVPSQVAAGSLVSVPWPAHSMALTSPIHESGSATASFAGPPGEFAWLLYAEDAALLHVPFLVGTLTLDFPVSSLAIGLLDASGQAERTITAALPPGVLAQRFHLQALYLDVATNDFTLSTPGVLVIVADGL